MKRNKLIIHRWGVLWHSKNRLDGVREYIVFENFAPKLCRTKKEAAEFIKQKYGYIAKRQDLRGEPHGWRMPKPIKVKATVSQE